MKLTCVFFWVHRAAGSRGGGHGPHQPGHARRREKPGRPGKVLRHVCPTLEKVSALPQGPILV